MPKPRATQYRKFLKFLKFLKFEKAKTKLTKKLLKGTNKTKSNIEVKKIVIKEHLNKRDQTEYLSPKKLNLQELVMRLNHTNSCTEALRGLKELITCHSNILNQNLQFILQKITPLVLNVDKVIRHETFEVLHLIFSEVKTNKLTAFFSFLLTYLRLAMTHVDNNIQGDSLHFMDILLLRAPECVLQDFHKILPIFFGMISKLHNYSNPTGTLKIEIDNKNTSVEWRIKVLNRLADFLLVFVDHNLKKEKKNVTYRYDKNKMNFFNLFDERYLSNTSMTVLKIGDSHNNVMGEAAIFSCYIDTLMPLLFEILFEVQNQRIIENILTEDAAIVLEHVLQIISLIIIHLKYLDIKRLTTDDVLEMFYNKYRKQFHEHIMKGFPYVTIVRTGRVQQTATASGIFDVLIESQMFIENLQICRLFINFNPHPNFEIQNNQAISVLNYLNETFNNANPDVNKVMISVLDSIFCNESTGWTKNIQQIDSLFKKLVFAYVNCSKSNIFSEEYFCLLCKISLTDGLNLCHNTYNEWLKHMPDILLQHTISSRSVDMFQKFSVRWNEVFNNILKDKQVEIIRNLPLIKINEGSKLDTDLVYYKLYSALFYYGKKWHAEALELLAYQMENMRYSEDRVNYIFRMLKFRNEMNNET